MLLKFENSLFYPENSFIRSFLKLRITFLNFSFKFLYVVFDLILLILITFTDFLFQTVDHFLLQLCDAFLCVLHHAPIHLLDVTDHLVEMAVLLQSLPLLHGVQLSFDPPNCGFYATFPLVVLSLVFRAFLSVVEILFGLFRRVCPYCFVKPLLQGAYGLHF